MSGPAVPRIVTLVIVLLAAARVATVWPNLPLEVASHFGAGGEPNGWMSREQFFGTMAAIGGGVSALLLLLPLVLAVIPTKFINLPNREYFLADDRRDATIARLGSLMAWLGVSTTALIALVLELSIQANLKPGPLDNGIFLLGMGVYLLSIVVTLVATYRAFRLPRSAG
ncbi:MAG TPA: DUF1648 domain-containing protein [Polyangiaceae bacterium]